MPLTTSLGDYFASFAWDGETLVYNTDNDELISLIIVEDEDYIFFPELETENVKYVLFTRDSQGVRTATKITTNEQLRNIRCRYKNHTS